MRAGLIVRLPSSSSDQAASPASPHAPLQRLPVLTRFLEAVTASFPSTHAPLCPPGPPLTSRVNMCLKYIFMSWLSFSGSSLVNSQNVLWCVCSQLTFLPWNPFACFLQGKAFWTTFHFSILRLEMKLCTQR